MKQGAIFDMDGLLFDTERVYNEEWYKIAKQYKLKIEQKMLDQLRGTNGELMERIVNSYWPSVNASRLCEELFENARTTLSRSVPLKPGAVELLNYFKTNGVKMAVASSAPLALIQSNLELSELAMYFDVVVSGDQVEHGKPEPDIFLLAAEELHLQPQDCYVFEDGINGVTAGARAGCATIMVPDLLMPKKEQYEQCVGIYESLLAVLIALKEEGC